MKRLINLLLGKGNKKIATREEMVVIAEMIMNQENGYNYES